MYDRRTGGSEVFISWGTGLEGVGWWERVWGVGCSETWNNVLGAGISMSRGGTLRCFLGII